MLADVLGRGLPSARVIAVYSSIVDTIVRRTIQLTFQRHPDLTTDAFTWLALGSNGRREAVLSSDVDSAVAFVDGVPPDEITRYRAVFAEVDEMLIGAGLMSDDHGASARRTLFARTNADWRTQAKRWLAAPTDGNGAMMTSLLVDGRPVHGDTGLTEVAKVFSDLRRHPGTMRLLLQESLSSRARLHSMRQVLSRRNDTFDVKTYAIVPVVNIGRWAAQHAHRGFRDPATSAPALPAAADPRGHQALRRTGARPALSHRPHGHRASGAGGLQHPTTHGQRLELRSHRRLVVLRGPLTSALTPACAGGRGIREMGPDAAPPPTSSGAEMHRLRP